MGRDEIRVCLEFDEELRLRVWRSDARSEKRLTKDGRDDDLDRALLGSRTISEGVASVWPILPSQRHASEALVLSTSIR